MKRVLVVAQDLGGAKALAPVVEKLRSAERLNIDVLAAEQVRKVFSNENIRIHSDVELSVLELVASDPDLVLTGAGMRKSIEKEAIAAAQARGIVSVTLLDSHLWGWNRFTEDGQADLSALADHILIGDEYCRDVLIRDGFPRQRLVITGNPHFDVLSERVGQGSLIKRGDILIVTQPVYEKNRYDSDWSWLETVLSCCRGVNPELRLTIRPHGKEDPMPFGALGDDVVRLDTRSDILDLIEGHEVVIGKDSTVLWEAMLLGRRVVSFASEKEQLMNHPLMSTMGVALIDSPRELMSTLTTVLTEGGVRQVERNIAYYTDGLNGRRVVDFLKTILDV